MNISIKNYLCLALNIITPIAMANIPLFDAYPALEKKLPYVALGNLETTPIINAGNNLYIKNDGVYGTDKSGKIIFTGNKRRKLEFLLADAIAQGKKRVIAKGGAGSNFCTATAAYAQELGLASTLVLAPQRNTRYAQRNLKLDLFYGADIVACAKREERTPTCDRLALQDPTSYKMELGGSDKIGAIGYVNAAFELKNQIARGVMPKPDVIYITVSSTGMAAGLIVGVKAANLDIIIKPVRIDDTPQEIEDELSRLIRETSTYLNQQDETFPLVEIAPEHLNIINDMAGEEYVQIDHAKFTRHANLGFDAYALITRNEANAIKKLYKNTGIKLDGTYSGKTFAACLRDLNSGAFYGKTVLFWNSFCTGDFSEYTSTVDAKNLPEELQKYINEDPGYQIQRLDQGI